MVQKVFPGGKVSIKSTMGKAKRRHQRCDRQSFRASLDHYSSAVVQDFSPSYILSFSPCPRHAPLPRLDPTWKHSSQLRSRPHKPPPPRYVQQFPSKPHSSTHPHSPHV